MALYLTDSSGLQVELLPEYNFKDSGSKVEDRHRTRDGSEFVYKWGEYREISFDVRYVDSSFRAIVNSWWAVNENLIYNDESITNLAWSIESSTYESEFRSFSAEDAVVNDVVFGNSGQKLYALGSVSGTIYQYTPTTAWEVQSASYDSKSFVVGSQDTNPHALCWKPDGTKFFVLGRNTNDVFQYSTLTAWEIDSASYDSKFFDASCWQTLPHGMDFDQDGTKFFLLDDTGNLVVQYATAAVWDIESATYESLEYVTSEGTILYGLHFRNNGLEFYISDNTGDIIYKYTVTSAYQVNSDTVSYSGVSLDVSSETTALRGMSFSEDGDKLYYLSTNTVYQRNMDKNVVDVRITNKSKPVDQFEKPYDNLFKGTIELGTY